MDDQFKALRDALANAPTSAVYTHPRDDNRWEANEAFAYACAPETIRALLAEVEALREFKARLISSLQHDAGARPLNEWGRGYVQASKDLLAGIDAALSAKEHDHG